MERSQKVLNIYCKASGAKGELEQVNGHLGQQKTQNWEWGQEVKLQWISEGKGVRYLRIQVCFHLPPEVNFDKLLSTL
jgi:hypothetical protein